jgi:queuine tRNA-ribosyltransferase
VEAVEDLLPRHKPRYAMGVGMPAELQEYVARGVDMMDCVLPSRNARNGYLFTSAGPLIIKHARYKDDGRAVDEKCECYTCRNYSRAYLRHLYLAGEMLYAVLATRHNLRRYLDIMREIRQAIISDKFAEYLRSAREACADAG